MAKDQWAHIDDNTLLEKYYSDGNNLWLGILLERYTMLLLGVCMKYLKDADDAKDAVQQIFLKVITELPKYKVAYFKSWLYMIAKNQCLMRLRSLQTHLVVPLEAQVSTPDPSPISDLQDKEQLLTLIEEGLTTLNEAQQVCVSLFYLEKKSYSQIVDITGYSLLQVKSCIQNGKRNLKLLVEKKLQQSNG